MGQNGACLAGDKSAENGIGRGLRSVWQRLLRTTRGRRRCWATRVLSSVTAEV